MEIFYWIFFKKIYMPLSNMFNIAEARLVDPHCASWLFIDEKSRSLNLLFECWACFQEIGRKIWLHECSFNGKCPLQCKAVPVCFTSWKLTEQKERVNNLILLNYFLLQKSKGLWCQPRSQRSVFRILPLAKLLWGY